MEVDAALGRNEPDYEIRELLRASTGLNLALDFLPGSVMFDPAANDRPSEDLASAAVWFDAFVTNIDRTARNPNLLLWHKSLYFIDHGAALYFHHDWKDTAQMARSRFPAIRDHVLLPWAARIEQADRELRATARPRACCRNSGCAGCVPEDWLSTPRADYVDYFLHRLDAAANS